MSHKPAFIAEQHVQLAARHFIRRGDVVYDVGANRGWLTVSFSRLVGSQGCVACFEASPRNIPVLSTLVSDYNLANVEVVGVAVYQESHMTVNIFENPFSNTDSIYFRSDDAQPSPVRTISLDDFHAFTGLSPSLVKMDIEGAEYDALVGATEMVQSVKPVFLIEMRKDDLRPLHFLSQKGYRGFNLKTFDEVSSEEDFEKGGIVEDLLFIHEDKIESQSAYFLKSANGQSFLPVDVNTHVAGTVVLFSFQVDPGFNCVQVKSRASGRLNVACTVFSGGHCVVRSDAGYYLICEPYLSFTVFSEKSEKVTVCIETTSGDNPVEILSVEVKNIPLDPISHKHHSILKLVQPFTLPIEQTISLLDRFINIRNPIAFEMVAEHARLTAPGHPRLLYLSGVSALHMAHPNEALELFDQALRAGFDQFWGQYMRTSALRSLGRLAEARAAALKADAASPGQMSIRSILEELLPPPERDVSPQEN